MCLLQQLLEPRSVARNIVRRTIRRRRFGALARDSALQWMGGRTASRCSVTSAPARVQLVDRPTKFWGTLFCASAACKKKSLAERHHCSQGTPQGVRVLSDLIAQGATCAREIRASSQKNTVMPTRTPCITTSPRPPLPADEPLRAIPGATTTQPRRC